MKIKIKDIQTMAQALINIVEREGCDYGEGAALELAEKIIHETTDKYEEGWHDALEMALKESMTYHTEEGTFKCVQEETLIGLGLSHQQSTINLEREVQI